ncbi:c-type cytochrome [Sphingomonas quercus]|uniref:Cytochrome c n=1 Tax=Sphingomonas quercus TaxID=2842451 RepID=A0ABS6BG21_9SPHN|nr:cytochrome c [Sphingomonas quercus]MBU3076782.1 cytochrome c [Sphingomonas quercus]
MTMTPHKIGLLLCAGLGVVTLAGAAAAQYERGYPYRSGEETYQRLCQGCHMPDARGATGAGAYPALTGNRKLQTPLYPVLIVLRGQKAMPPFSDLTDQQVADVANYIRSHFGNSFAGQITVDQVKGLRARAVGKNDQRPG